jgi:CDP-glucose 4,6-dehydratase
LTTIPAGNGWRHKNILVTGATGFLGSWLTMRLIDRGACVTILERDFTPRSYLIRSGYFDRCNRVRGDTRDGSLIERALVEYEVDYVFHLASQAIVSIANKSPVSTLEQNVIGTAKVLDACRRVGVKRVLVSSSDKAYGTHGNLPYQEDYPLQGRHPYDCSKSCEDLVSQMYAHSYGMEVVIVRSGNMYGPGDLNYSRIIPKTIRNLLTGQAPVIYGNGEMKRDYTYVDDCADACMLLMDQSTPPGAYNVSGSAVHTVKEVIALISRRMGIDTPPVYQGVNNEIDSQWLDVSKLQAIGWKPAHTFEDGLDLTIEFYKGVV